MAIGKLKELLAIGALALASVVVASCSAKPAGLTSVGAEDGGTQDIAGGDASRPVAQAQGGTLPCAVDSILQRNCRTCHGSTTQFGAPMSLVTYADLHAPMKSNPTMPVYQGVATRIAKDSMPMPPPPNPRLSSADESTLLNWTSGGAPSADGADACTAPDGSTEISSPADDASITIGGDSGYGTDEATGPSDCTNYYDMQAHANSASNDTTPYPVTDDTNNQGNTYVCFYFNPPYPANSQGLWFSPILDQTRVLHHWLLYASNSNSQPDGTVKVCQAVEPGWYLIAGWAPGNTATSYPPDVGLQMPSAPGQLILQVHYYDLQNLNLKDRSGVRFCTAPANTRAHTATVTFTGSEGICLPPNSSNFEVSGNCQPRSDMGDIHIVSAWPHMHKLGVRMQINVTRAGVGDAGGPVETLHDGPFDFNSQTQFAEDMVLHAGDTMQTNCFYDNTTDQKVPFGENTQDEMCYGFITAWPANALVTDPKDQNFIQNLGKAFQQQTRCLNNVAILQSCNGLADYPVAK